MSKIYKYTLEITDFQSLALPFNAEILSVQAQNNSICLWAKFKDESETEERYFRIIGTGHEFEEKNPSVENLNFISTVQLNGLVWHIFESE